jgi:ankyrin repeat protein
MTSSGQQLTVSEQLQWIKDGVPRSLYSMLERRLVSVFSNAVAELREFVEAVPSSCVCDVCAGLLDKPMKATDASSGAAHVACEACVLKPGSHATAWAPLSAWSADSKRRAQVFALKTHCPLGDCEWLGKRSALQPHVEEDCDFTPMPCLYAGCDARLVRCVYLLHLKGCKHKPRGAKLPDDAPHVKGAAAAKDELSSSSSSTPLASSGNDKPKRKATMSHKDSSQKIDVAAAGASEKEREKQRRKEKRETRRKEKRDAISSSAKLKSPRHHRAPSSDSESDAAASAPAPAASAASGAVSTASVMSELQTLPLTPSDLQAAANAAGIDLSKSQADEHVMTAAEARLAAMSQPRVREDNHHKALRRAAFDGDTDELTKLLADPQTDVNSRDKSGMSLMVSACVNGRLAACRALMRAGADASLKSATGNGPLHYLCKWKPGTSAAAAPASASRPQSPTEDAVATTAGAAGADAAAGLGKVARPAGVVSSTRQYQRLLTKLIESGASIAANDQGETPLHIACRSANIAAAITLLTTTDIDVNLPSTAFSYTALHLAAKVGDGEMVKMLLKHGADPLLRAQNFAKRSMIHGLRVTGTSASAQQRNLPLTALEIAKRSHGSDDLLQVLKHAEMERRAALPPGAINNDDTSAEGPTTPRGMARPGGPAASAPPTLQSRTFAAPPLPPPPAATASTATAAAATSNTTDTTTTAPPSVQTLINEGPMAEKKRASVQWGSLRSGAVAQMATLSKEEMAELMAAVQKADGVDAGTDESLVKANSDDEDDDSSSSDSGPLSPPAEPQEPLLKSPPQPEQPSPPQLLPLPSTALPVMNSMMMRQHADKMASMQMPAGKVQISVARSTRWEVVAAPPSPEPEDERDNLAASESDVLARRKTRQSRRNNNKLSKSDVAIGGGVVEDKS